MASPTEQEITRIINGYEQANAAANYGETIVCEMQLVSDENYQMVWSSQYNGQFNPQNY